MLDRNREKRERGTEREREEGGREIEGRGGHIDIKKGNKDRYSDAEKNFVIPLSPCRF